jgi:hypothetical protein
MVKKIRSFLKTLFSNKELKQYFIWPLFIAMLGVILTYSFSVYTDRSNKEYLLQEKKLSIISNLTQSFSTYAYYAGFRAMIQLEKMEYVKYFVEIPDANINMVHVPISKRIRLQDTLRKIYPLVYDKMMEGDLKTNETLMRDIYLGQLFFSNSLGSRINKLLDFVPIENEINRIIDERRETNSTKLSETEKDSIMDRAISNARREFELVINLMIAETK